MLVWRVENDAQQGPYQMLWQPTHSVGLIRAPLPEMDGIDPIYGQDYFGFHALPLYFNWFPDFNREALTKRGYYLKAFAVADCHVKVGKRQCCFLRPEAKALATWQPNEGAKAWGQRHQIAAIAAAETARLNAQARQAAAAAQERRVSAKAGGGPGAERGQRVAVDRVLRLNAEPWREPLPGPLPHDGGPW